MADTQTPNLKLIKPELEGSPETWGEKLNVDMDKIDAYASTNRMALQTALQTGGSGGSLPAVDDTNPRNLGTDKAFRTAAQPLYYAEGVTLDESFPFTLPSILWVKQLIDLVLPIRTIIMWAGTVAEIPPGWTLCDNKGHIVVDGNDIPVPNLSGRFVLGAYNTGGPATMLPGQTGGTAGDLQHNHVITVNDTFLSRLQIPGHTHAAAPAAGVDGRYIGLADSGGTWDLAAGTDIRVVSSGLGNVGNNGAGAAAAGHNHTATSAENTEPVPYYALCYIMKVKTWGYIPP